MNQFPYSTLFCITSGRFLSAGTGLASLTLNNMPSRVRATVLSWICGFAGSRPLNSRFIWANARTQFSLIMSSRHSRISSSTRTLFRPTRGSSSICPSLRYLAGNPLLHLQTLSWSVHDLHKESCFFGACLLCSTTFRTVANIATWPNCRKPIFFFFCTYSLYVSKELRNLSVKVHACTKNNNGACTCVHFFSTYL